MALPHVAESLEKLKARYSDAILITWLPSETMVDRPGLHREHVFDFDQGIRLIISKEIIKQYGNKEYLHFSASADPKIWGEEEQNFLRVAHICITELSGLSSLNYLGLSKGGIPHWLSKDPV